MPVTTPSRQDALYKHWRARIFFITWLAYVGFYLTRKSFAVAKVDLARPEVMGLGKTDMAWMDGAYLALYAAGQFVWGMCGDRFGTRRVVLAGMMASVLTGALMGASSIVVLMGALFCFQGVCQSTGWAPLSKNICNFYSQRERGRVMGFWATNYAIGGVLASALAGLAIEWGGHWRFAFWVPAGVLLCIWGLFFWLQRNRPQDVGLPPIEEYKGEPRAVLTGNSQEAEAEEGSWQLIWQVMRNRMVLLLAGVYFFMKPTRYLILFWSPLYVNEKLGTGAAKSGILGSMFELAGPLGVLMGGYLSDKVFATRRMPAAIISLFVVAVALCFFNNLPATPLTIGLGFFVIGFFLYMPDSLVSATAAIDFGTRQGAATASGMINGFGSIGAIIGGVLPGVLQSQLGEGVDIWPYVFPALGGSLIIAALLLLPRWNALPTTVSGKE